MGRLLTSFSTERYFSDQFENVESNDKYILPQATKFT